MKCPPLHYAVAPFDQQRSSFGRSCSHHFIMKLYDMLRSGKHAEIIGWSPSGKSFRVHDWQRFEAEVLRKHFDGQSARRIPVHPTHISHRLLLVVIRSIVIATSWLVAGWFLDGTGGVRRQHELQTWPAFERCAVCPKAAQPQGQKEVETVSCRRRPTCAMCARPDLRLRSTKTLLWSCDSPCFSQVHPIVSVPSSCAGKQLSELLAFRQMSIYLV